MTEEVISKYIITAGQTKYGKKIIVVVFEKMDKTPLFWSTTEDTKTLSQIKKDKKYTIKYIHYDNENEYIHNVKII